MTSISVFEEVIILATYIINMGSRNRLVEDARRDAVVTDDINNSVMKGMPLRLYDQ